MSKELDDALKYVMDDIEEARTETSTPVVKPVDEPTDVSAAQKRIESLKNNKYAQAAHKAATANSAEDFLDAVIESEGAKKGIFGLEEGDYDVYSNI